MSSVLDQLPVGGSHVFLIVSGCVFVPEEGAYTLHSDGWNKATCTEAYGTVGDSLEGAYELEVRDVHPSGFVFWVVMDDLQETELACELEERTFWCEDVRESEASATTELGHGAWLTTTTATLSWAVVKECLLGDEACFESSMSECTSADGYTLERDYDAP